MVMFRDCWQIEPIESGNCMAQQKPDSTRTALSKVNGYYYKEAAAVDNRKRCLFSEIAFTCLWRIKQWPREEDVASHARRMSLHTAMMAYFSLTVWHRFKWRTRQGHSPYRKPWCKKIYTSNWQHSGTIKTIFWDGLQMLLLVCNCV